MSLKRDRRHAAPTGLVPFAMGHSTNMARLRRSTAFKIDAKQMPGGTPNPAGDMPRYQLSF
jgi:hypothetical protein